VSATLAGMGNTWSAQTRAWESSGRYVEIPGHRLFVLERGQGPLLVLVHGFPTSSYDYRALIERLQSNFRCIAFDFPGYGLSDKSVAYSYSLFQQADAMEALMRTLGVKRTRVLCHDMGTSVMCELLARHEEGRLGFELEHVTFTNGSMLQWLADITPFQKLMASNETLPQAIELCAQIPGSMVAGLRGLTRRKDAISADDEIVIRELLAHDDGHLRLPALAGYMRERYVHKERWIGALTRHARLASIVWATEDPIANLAMGRALHALLPAAPYVELDGVGHFVIFEDPARVAAAVLATAGRPDPTAGRPDPG
jgi:pimeloyl-ACP methyl ester carboxylesterase